MKVLRRTDYVVLHARVEARQEFEVTPNTPDDIK